MEIEIGLILLNWITGPMTENWNPQLVGVTWTTGPLTTSAEGR